MNPSQLLRKFLSTGTKPASVRDQSALLDESRSILISKLPTTGEIMMNFTEAELDSVDMKSGNVLQQMHKIYDGKQKANAANHPRSSASPARPAASVKPSPARPAAAAPAPPRPAASKPHPAPRLKESTDILMRAATMRGISETDRMAARAELEARGFTELPKGGFTKSQ
jgi:hypothetical protein